MGRKEEYTRLLSDDRWKSKRSKIISRDNNKCQHCFSKYNLHVHHLVYRVKTLPWNYKNHELITLCESCHVKAHAEKKIKVISNKKINSISKIDKLKMNLSKRDFELQKKYDLIRSKFIN